MSDAPEHSSPKAEKQPEPHAHSHAGDALNQLSTLKAYAHSPIIYWWPIWMLGLLFGFISMFMPSGNAEALDTVSTAARVQGQTFVFVLIFVIFSTTVKLRGANSVILGLILAIGIILLIMGNLFGPIAAFIGGLEIYMSPSFYWFVGITVFLMWAIMVFGFDKVKYYEIAPGQVRERVYWGSGDRA
ncbi:MAG: hypothetical protein AAF686_09715, partial [Pseudomonadota bacterium]